MRAVLVHGKPEAGAEGIDKLKAAGWEARLFVKMTPALIREWASDVPDVIVLDLSHRPSHIKELAGACRQRKALRTVPMLFVEGTAENVESLRARFPEAIYSTWAKIKSALRSAVAQKGNLSAAPPKPTVYTTPLPKKLGIIDGIDVAALDAPDNLEEILGPLPSGATVERDGRGPARVVIQFVRSREELIQGLPRAVRKLADRGKLWIAYPKKASGMSTNITQEFLREYALTHGLVDYKVCSIDATWTGFCFSRARV